MHRDEIVQSILDVLKNKSATFRGIALLNGSWGCGKTYLWEKEIRPNLEKILPSKDMPILYVSLFGAENCEDIKSKIISQILTDSNFYKNGEEIKERAKFLIKLSTNAVQKIFGKEVFTFKLDPFNLINKEYVICFDDVERKSEKLDIKSLLGLISHLHEIKKCKILLIANEEAISGTEKHFNSEDGRAYQSFIEKLVSFKFRLSSSISEFFDILSADYKSNGEDFFEKNKQIILGIFRAASVDNLRTLEKAFRIIAQILKSKINVYEHFLRVILFYVICDSEGTLSKGKEYYDFSPYTLNRKPKDTPSNSLETEKLKMVERFFGRNDWYLFCEPLFDFVLTGFFDKAALKPVLDPDIKAPTKCLQYLKTFQGQEKIYYMNDAQLEEKYLTGLEVLNDKIEPLRADALAAVVSNMRICKIIAGGDLTIEQKNQIIAMFNRLADEGDDSFASKSGRSLGHYKQYWEEFVVEYDKKIELGVLNRKISEVKEMVAAKLELPLLEHIHMRAENVIATLKALEPEEFANLYLSEREFGISILDMCIERMVPSADPQSSYCWDRYYSWLEAIFLHPKREKSDLYRLKNIVAKAQVHTPIMGEVGKKFNFLEKLNI